MSSKREKELKRLIALKIEIISKATEELKNYKTELQHIEKKNTYCNKSKIYRKK